MESTNFKPLQKRWPQLYEHANIAEQYIYSDACTAIVKLRCFAEQLVGILYSELNLSCERNDGFFEKLKASIFIEAIDETILEKLHAICMLGNKAAHGRNINSNDALVLLRDAYLIGQWLFKTYSRGAIYDDYPAYIDPVHFEVPLHTLSEEKKQLEVQLRRVKDELAILEESERIAQNQTNELKKPLDKTKLQTFMEASSNAALSFDLAPESTRNLIKLSDAFSEYSLTDGQTELINHLADFLDSKDEHVFLLKGYAGTGKTFITKGLTEYFRAIGRNYALAAPTGKASKVIAKKTLSPAYTIHKMIYSFKDMAEYRDNNLDGSETYKFYAQLAVNEMSADTVFIVDEASMIADNNHEEEFFRFGSGYLLRDFFKFVNLDHNDHNKKVIFIGDDAQLPPIGMKFSPALDGEYLYQKHNVKSISYELTEVVRQKADSGVMHNAIKLRKALDKKIFNQLTIDLNYPDLKKVSHQDLLNCYLDSCGKKINGESIVLAHSNADVAAYNRRIRKYFFPNTEEITCGDKVMVTTNSNAYEFFISNGDFGLVKKVLSSTEHRNITLRRKNTKTNKAEEIPIALAFKKVIVGFKDLEGKSHFFEAIILENLLYSEHSRLTSDESKALYLDFCIRHQHLKRRSLEFKETLKSDPYFNALRLKFGYAITCHKAQGSEWNHVFVKCKTHQNQSSEGYFRWFYTAITRTSNKLYLLDPPTIKLGSNIKVISSPNITTNGGFNSSIAKNTDSLTTNNDMIIYPTDENMAKTRTDESFGIPSNAYFSLEILKRVRELTENSGINIQDVNQGQYQEVYFFQKDSETARVYIYYNGKGKISRIYTPKQTEFSGKIINLISPLSKVIIVPMMQNSSTNFEFEETFLNDFHKRLYPLTEQKGIVINNVESMSWKQRYTFVQSGESAVFDIFYNGKNQFTKCSSVRNACSSNTLSADVQAMLTEGLSL